MPLHLREADTEADTGDLGQWEHFRDPLVRRAREISGIPRGPANAGGMNNAAVDPSGTGNAARMATLPQPHIAAPTQPGGSRNPAAPLSMNLNQRALPEALGGGGRQPRADQVPSEQGLMDPNDPYDRELNRENAAVDGTLDICRGC